MRAKTELVCVGRTIWSTTALPRTEHCTQCSFGIAPHTLVPFPCRVPRKQVHTKLRDAFLHRFRQLSGIAIEDQGVALLQASWDRRSVRMPLHTCTRAFAAS